MVFLSNQNCDDYLKGLRYRLPLGVMDEFVRLEEVARVEIGEAVDVELARFVCKFLLLNFNDFLLSEI